MTTAIRFGLLTLLLLAAGAQASTRDYHFAVLLDGKPIGHHRFAFQPAADGYRLVSEASYDVKILFINAYQYRHRSEEHWADGCLYAIQSTTDDNGEAFSVAGKRQGAGLALEVNGVAQVVGADCIRSFAYWDSRLLTGRALLNSQTGELEPVAPARKGPAPLPWQPSRIADSIELGTEDGTIQLWYDADGTWLGLRSTLSNGRVLQYQPASVEVEDNT